MRSCCLQVKEYLADPSAFASAAPAASEEKEETKEEAKQEVGGCTCIAFVWLPLRALLTREPASDAPLCLLLPCQHLPCCTVGASCNVYC